MFDLTNFRRLWNAATANHRNPTAAVINNLSEALDALGQLTGGIESGQPSTCMYGMATNMVAGNTDTETIGADVYEFLAAGDTVTADTNIGVLIAATAPLTLAAFAAAINGTQAATGILTSTGAAAPAVGTEQFLATVDVAGTHMHIASSDGPGGTVIARVDTTTVASTATAADNLWDVTTAGATAIHPGRVKAQVGLKVAQLTITTAMITAGYTSLTFPEPQGDEIELLGPIVVYARDSAGKGLTLQDDTFVLEGNRVDIVLAGQAGDLANTNIVTILALAAAA